MHRTTPHRARSAALLLTAALALSACGGGSDDATAASSAGTSTSASPTSPAPAEASAIEPATVESTDFSGPAVDAFGADQVQAAYDQIAQFASRNSFVVEHMDYGVVETPADYEGPGVIDQMTPAMLAGYRNSVAGAFAGDADATSSLRTITYTGLVGADGLSFRDSGPAIVDHTIGSASAAFDETSGGRLALTFSQHVSVRADREGEPVLFGLDKTVTYYLMPPAGGETVWLIDGLEADWGGGRIVADTSES